LKRRKTLESTKSLIFHAFENAGGGGATSRLSSSKIILGGPALIETHLMTYKL